MAQTYSLVVVQHDSVSRLGYVKVIKIPANLSSRLDTVVPGNKWQVIMSVTSLATDLI